MPASNSKAKTEMAAIDVASHVAESVEICRAGTTDLSLYTLLFRIQARSSYMHDKKKVYYFQINSQLNSKKVTDIL
jgi:hypothetical protein